jgi:hypothetical protein
MRQFGEDFDATVWEGAFSSPDPDDINRVFTVTGGYMALLNNTVEAVRVGAKSRDAWLLRQMIRPSVSSTSRLCANASNALDSIDEAAAKVASSCR